MTGHKSVDMVRDHYFRPDREDFREEFEKVNLTGAGEAPDLLEQIREGLRGVTEMNWREERNQLLDKLGIGEEKESHEPL